MTLRLLAIAALVAAAPLAAQPLSPTVWLEAGSSTFDLSGTGTAGVLGARADLEFGRYLVAEAGLGYFRAEETFSDVSYAQTDVELQVQLPLGRVRPYLGVGVGQLVVLGETQRPLPDGIISASPDGSNAALLTASVGARVGLQGPVYARLGARFRGAIGDGPDVFGSTLGEVTLGAGYRF